MPTKVTVPMREVYFEETGMYSTDAEILIWFKNKKKNKESK